MPEFYPAPQAESPSVRPSSVRLELRAGDGSSTSTQFHQDSIVIGSALGCDVKLPDGEQPGLLCILTHEPEGLRLRRLAPIQALQLNDQPATDGLVLPDDRLTFGGYEATLRFAPRTVPMAEPVTAGDQAALIQKQMLEDGIRRRAVAQQQLADDRRDWEQDAEQQAEKIAAQMRQVLEREEALAKERAQLDEQRVELGRRGSELESAPVADAKPAPAHTGAQSVDELRQQLETYRDELFGRYKKRRDHLLALQESVQHAARKVQDEKRSLTAEAERLRQMYTDLATHQTDCDTASAKLAEVRAALIKQHHLIEDWQREVEREYDSRLAQVEAEEARQTDERARLESLQKHYETDRTRLDRQLVEFQERERICAERSRQLDEQTGRFKELAAGLQDQARELEEVDTRTRAESQALAQHRAAINQDSRAVEEKNAALEAQQAALLTLQTRTERTQSDLLQREQQLTEQRLRQDQMEGRLRELAERLQRNEADVHRERARWVQADEQLEARCEAFASHVAEVHAREQSLEQRSGELQQRHKVVADALAKSVQISEALRLRGEQLQELRTHLLAQGDTLREREQQLVQDHQSRELREEQLRQQTESLAERERQLAEQAAQIADESRRTQESASTWQARLAELEARQLTFDREFASRHQELMTGESRLAQRASDLQRQLDQVGSARVTLEAERQAVGSERQAAAVRQCEAAAEHKRLELELQDLQQRLPDLCQQAQAALDRSGKAREQLRDHLREVHEYAQQCQTEFQISQRELLNQAEQLREQQHVLICAQNDHRHAVSSFRQYVSEWQGQIAELKQIRQRDETTTQLTKPSERAEHDVLAMGPLRILDRLRVTQLETVYRVFDPRRADEALLRHLSPAVPAERQAEFRQRFQHAAALRHENLAATLEVLEMDGSPAVLQEWTAGLPSGEWQEVAAVPGVWLRLLRQAAAGLNAAHEAGLVHGHLHAGRVLLAEDGAIKICGLGEPAWLIAEAPGAPFEAEASQDLRALGRMAKNWLGAAPTLGATRDGEKLQAVVERLLAVEPAKCYASAAALLEHLERLQLSVVNDATAWEKLLRFVRDRLQPAEPLEQRRSA